MILKTTSKLSLYVLFLKLLKSKQWLGCKYFDDWWLIFHDVVQEVAKKAHCYNFLWYLNTFSAKKDFVL